MTGLATLDAGRHLLSGRVTPGRAVLGDDPALGFAVPSPLPVLLLEPVETFMAVDPAGRSRELQAELLVQQGFQLLGPDDEAVAPLPGWSVVHTPTQVRLRDGDGELWAYSYARPGRRWLAEAEVRRRVLVLFGALVGVRAPRGVPAVQYAAVHRAAELQAGRARGIVAAAVLAWQS
jgi:hypothetical protein